MRIEKYFWGVKSNQIKKLKEILKSPQHPKFPEKMYAILTRCDNPKELFTLISEDTFIEYWPRIRRDWIKRGGGEDFRYWWEAVYEQLLEERGGAVPYRGIHSKVLRMIGNLIREKRMEKGYTQKDLAMKIGLRQPDISKIEKGRVNITLETLIRICKVLGIGEVPLLRG